MFVLAKRRLIKSQASELPGPQHLGISASQPLRCQKSRRVLRPANVIRLPSFHPSPQENPRILLACLCHKLQLEIVRNYIKFLLPHT